MLHRNINIAPARCNATICCIRMTARWNRCSRWSQTRSS